jgi:hypothetical protein
MLLFEFDANTKRLIIAFRGTGFPSDLQKQLETLLECEMSVKYLCNCKKCIDSIRHLENVTELWKNDKFTRYQLMSDDEMCPFSGSSWRKNLKINTNPK